MENIAHIERGRVGRHGVAQPTTHPLYIILCTSIRRFRSHLRSDDDDDDGHAEDHQHRPTSFCIVTAYSLLAVSTTYLAAEAEEGVSA